MRQLRALSAALFLALALVAPANAQTANVCRNVNSPCVTEDFVAVPTGAGTATLASAAHTTAQTGDDQDALGYEGVRCLVNVTANPSGVTLTATIQGYDDVSAAHFNILTSSTLINDTAAHEITIHPGATAVSGISNGEVLPATWRFTISPGSATSTTYSAACSRLP